MKITLKRSNVLEGTVAKPPTAAQMEYGEFAVNYNTADPSVFIKDSGNAIVKVAGKGSIGGQPDGVNTSVQFNDNDDFGGVAAFTYNKASGVLTAPTGNFTSATITQLQTDTLNVTGINANRISLVNTNPYMYIPSDGKITTANGAQIILGLNNSGSGTSLWLENTGITYKYNGQNPIKFEYAPGSSAQTYKLPAFMGQLSYVLGLTDTTSGQMGWIGMVPLGKWTEELIPTLT